MNEITAGRLLRSNTRGCVVGCHIRISPPALGSMVYIPTESGRIFGLIYDIHIDDDGLVRQLAASESISDEVILDNRLNRNTPVEMSIIFIGYQTGDNITHLLPPNPPLSLDKMHICSKAEIQRFTSPGQFGYFRYLIAEQSAPTADLFAAHLSNALHAQVDEDKQSWKRKALEGIINLLRDDHMLLTNVLSAVGDAFEAQKET